MSVDISVSTSPSNPELLFSSSSLSDSIKESKESEENSLPEHDITIYYYSSFKLFKPKIYWSTFVNLIIICNIVTNMLECFTF